MGGTPVFLYSPDTRGVSICWGCLMVTPLPSEVTTKISIRLAWLHLPPSLSAGQTRGSEGCSSARSEAEGPIGQSRERRADGQPEKPDNLTINPNLSLGGLDCFPLVGRRLFLSGSGIDRQAQPFLLLPHPPAAVCWTDGRCQPVRGVMDTERKPAR